MGNLTIQKTLTSEEKVSNGSPYAALFKDAILYAHKNKASDIHIEPTKDGVYLRMRINGELNDWKKLSIENRGGFIQEVKRLSNLSIAISNRPQDSRLSFQSWKLALRVNSTPMLYGEKIVLRLLDLSTSFSLKDSNYSEDCKIELHRAIEEKNGVIIMSGPTGSGKTRTLYSMLNSFEKSQKNIVTLEDPIEYTFDRINQIEINKNVSFASGLRAILRQDPDVILVGEIRDFETADLCFKAAATGHLVLTSLHANSSLGVIDRLLNIGVDKYIIQTNLRFAAAQRLLKEICPHCSISADEKLTSLLSEIAKDNSIKLDKQFYKEQTFSGCSNCQNGIIGRLPILEYFTKEELGLNSTKAPKTSLLVETIKLATLGIIDAKEVFNVG